MELPQPFELNEFNFILLATAELCDQDQSCSAHAVIDSCSYTVFDGRILDRAKLIKLCNYAGLLSYRQGRVKLTEAGREFLNHNPQGSYEITTAQKHWLVERIMFEGPWKSRVRDLFFRFNPQYASFTFELGVIEAPLPPRHNPTVHLLRALEVIEEIPSGVLRVKPAYVGHVVRLRARQRGTTEVELNEMLQADQELATQAEEAVVEYERKRLGLLGRRAEADSVRRISQLDVGAGYDIETFNGDKPQLECDRFIEVKASRGSALRFFWSTNERKVAEKLGDSYWIYFLGNFGLPGRGDISPIMIQNPAKRIPEISQLSIEPAKYLVTELGVLPLKPPDQHGLNGYIL